jgi:hypothetical protein
MNKVMGKSNKGGGPLSVKERLIGLLPMICLVHCAGTALLAAVLPAAALWMHNEWLEGLLSLLSALLIGTLVLRRRKAVDLIAVLFGATLALGLVGWIWDLSWLRHGSLLLLVGVQVLFMRERRVLQHDHECHAAECCAASDAPPACPDNQI